MSISKIEFEWAIKELTALSYLQLSRNTEGVALTTQGTDKAAEILDSLVICDRILLILHCAELGANSFEEDDIES